MGRRNLALRRGDVVLVAEGKPRPAVVVQSDSFPTPSVILMCPLTSDLTAIDLYRITVEPSATNGLRVVSQAMTDRVGPVRRDRVGATIGRLGMEDLRRLSAALSLILDLTD